MNISMMSLTRQNSPPEEIVKLAVDCGMCSVDWITTHKTDPAILGKMTKDAGLFVAAYTPLDNAYINGEDGWQDEFKRSLDAAVEMSAPVMMVPPFALKKHPDLSEGLKYWTDFFAWATPLAKAAGVVLTCESTGFSNSPVTTAEEVLSLIRNVPDLRVTFDNGNTETACDAVEAYKKLRQYVVRFHLKDWKISDEPIPDSEKKRNGKYFAMCVMGEGSVDLKKLWDEVDPESRKFTVNLETWHPDGTPLSAPELKKICDRMRNW